MKKHPIILGLVLALSSAGFAATASAKVSQAEAAKLGTELTPLGAEMKGNEAGTIPAWTGGLTEAPEDYKGSGSHHIDPFADDKPLFTITAENYAEYKDQLTEGQIALFKKYPETFKMPIYQTRRTHSAPDFIYENTKRNALTSELKENGNGITQAFGGVPFPMPKNALEVYWNHITRFRGEYVVRESTDANVYEDGNKALVTNYAEAKFKFYDQNASAEDLDNVLFYYISKTIQPARLAGDVLLVHETLDQVKEPRRAWAYSKGQRRVRRAPTVAFDSPVASSAGLRTADDTDLLNGAPTRYNWELKGKKEVFIPYNNYKISDAGTQYDELLTKGHLNPEYTRYELHRVWVISGTLKEGERHLYQRRDVYIDEDSWNAAVIDQFDQQDNIWRVSMAYLKNFYELPTTWTAADVYHDLQSGRYHVAGLTSEEDEAVNMALSVPQDNRYRSTALRRIGK